MDTSLFEACRTGNVSDLRALLAAHPLLLDTVALFADGNTPLHVSSMAGHLHFVQELLNLRPQFAQELDQHGYAAVHIAAANGAADIVRELIKVDPGLCLLKGKEGKIALHLAALKGRVGLMEELLLLSGDAIEEETARGETALHLAVKNNQFQAFATLVEHVKRLNKMNVLNKKDDQGNTLLHLAVSRKNYQVINLVLKEYAVEVNSLNARNLTPLDVLLLFQSEAGDREIEEILRRFGAVTAGETVLQTADQTGNVRPTELGIQPLETNSDGTVTLHSKSCFGKLNYLHFIENMAKQGDIGNAVLVLLTLIATVTYTGGLTPPGGLWQEDSKKGTKPKYVAGQSILGTLDTLKYILFMGFNTLGFYTSIMTILILISEFPLKLELWICFLTLSVTYCTSIVSIAPDGVNSLLYTILPVLIPYIIYLTRIMAKKKRKRDSSRVTNRQQQLSA